MIRLPKGVTVHVGGQRYRGEIPEAVCPPHLKPKPKPISKAGDK